LRSSLFFSNITFESDVGTLTVAILLRFTEFEMRLEASVRGNISELELGRQVEIGGILRTSESSFKDCSPVSSTDIR
jgi:hypothetical protein